MNSDLPLTKQGNFLITLLSILLLISCLIAGFFAYQTQQLVKELRVTRDELKQTPTPTPTPDLTANWKTYVSSCWGIGFKYPSEMVFKVSPLFECEVLRFENENGYMNIENGCGFDSITTPVDEILVLGQNISRYNIPQTIKWKHFTASTKQLNSQDKRCMYINFGMKEEFEKETDFIFNQILSTFKFTGSEPVACTMEAKICPDGTSVGRTGPNCEFPSCPKPGQ